MSMTNKVIEAARAVIARWDSPLWKDAPATAVFIGALREAVDSMEAQREQGPDWYHAECDDPDYSGFHLELGDALTQISEHGGYITELFTHAAPPSAEATPASEREALSARLAQQWAALDPADPYRDDARDAIDMLEADAQEIALLKADVHKGVDLLVDAETKLLDQLTAGAQQVVVPQEPVAWLVRWLPIKNEPRGIHPWVALSIDEYRSNPSREERPLVFAAPQPPQEQAK